MTNTNWLWTATHQTANAGRQTRAFDHPRDFHQFCAENERYITSMSLPTRDQIEAYARWIKRNTTPAGMTANAHDAAELLEALRAEWRLT
jgi:hypothetical protein